MWFIRRAVKRGGFSYLEIRSLNLLNAKFKNNIYSVVLYNDYIICIIFGGSNFISPYIVPPLVVEENTITTF